MKVYLETMGCQMNVLDSELVGSLLAREGFELVADARAAEVLLYNTCSVRQHAEDKAHSRLGWACQRKRAGRGLVVGVLGCMAQRLGAELLRRHPGLDIVCGPARLEALPELIRAAAAGRQAQLVVDLPRAARVAQASQPVQGQAAQAFQPVPAQLGKAVPPEPAQPGKALPPGIDCLRDASRTHLPGQAFVRIQRGCDKFCTYCVVPFVRGSEQSRPPGVVVEEVRRLVDGGITQVTLLGQTVNSYHADDGGRTVGLADLLERLDAVPGLRRLRFVTSYPAGFDVRILEAMRDLKTACPALHVPAQSGSDRVLRGMNRRYRVAEYDELVSRARQIVPGIALAGDFIVGFPGESEEDHAASAELIRRTRYRNAFIFKYSPRPGTTADKRLADDVPEDVKRRRNQELLGIQNAISLADNRRLVGQRPEVLVEGPSPRASRQPREFAPGQVQGTPNAINRVWGPQLVGRTRTDHIVVFDAPPELVGQYINVQIADATTLALVGEAQM